MEGKEGKVFNFYDGSQYVEHIDSQTNNYYGNNGQDTRQMSDDDLRNMINKVMPKITSNRLWFAIIKVLMLRGKIAYDDFEEGENLIKRLYPSGYPHVFDSADLKKLHTDCFRLPISEWNRENSPYKREAEYKQMFNLAIDFDALFV